MDIKKIKNQLDIGFKYLNIMISRQNVIYVFYIMYIIRRNIMHENIKKINYFK